jgi:hypothetical protein
MKKSGTTIRPAHLFEKLMAASVDGNKGSNDRYYTKELFALEGVAGVWRRVPRQSQGISKKRPNAELAIHEGVVIELVRDTEIEDELREAGFCCPEQPQGKPQEQPQEQAGPEQPTPDAGPQDDYPTTTGPRNEEGY